MFRSIQHPEAYHGERKHPPFFEGWYFKLIDKSQQHRLAVIPGVFMGRDSSNTHAFVQVIDGVSRKVAYIKHPFGEFSAASDRLEVRIGPNLFNAERMVLNLSGELGSIMGEIKFVNSVGWKHTFFSPGIMGPFSWAPFMQCYHGVISLDHELDGSLQMDGVKADFAGGRGYTEKDWGRAFPSAWIWMQTNSFSSPGSSLTASVAIIPWILGKSFPGFIVGLWHEGKLHRFATYLRSKVEKLAVTEESVEWILLNHTHRLELKAWRESGGWLAAPTMENMGRRIAESLSARIEVQLFARGREDVLLWRDEGSCGGLEVVGDIPHLLSLWQERPT